MPRREVTSETIGAGATLLVKGYGAGLPLNSFANSGWLQIVGRGFAAALVGNDLIGHLLPFMKFVRAGPFDRADIDEHICAAGVRLNEPEAFRCIDI